MDSNLLLQLALRLLPTLLLFVLAFIAASDKKSRERWAQLLYQMGSIRPDQRENPDVQRGVRWPFIAVALVFLVWPVLYYQYATREVAVSTSVFSQEAIAGAAKNAASAPSPSPSPDSPAVQVYTPPALDQAPAPGVAPQATPRVNIFGTPLPQ